MQSSIGQLIGSSFVSFMLSVMLMKAWMPFASRHAGQTLYQCRLAPAQRVMVHRTQLLLIILFVAAGGLPFAEGGWYLPGTPVAALAGALLILLLPLRYVFTDRGVSINNGVPRLYGDFKRFDVRSGGGLFAGTSTVSLRARRRGGRAVAGHTLFVPTGETSAVVRVLKRHVR